MNEEEEGRVIEREINDEKKFQSNRQNKDFNRN